MSVTINCNDFADIIKEIIGLAIPDKNSEIIGMMNMLANMSLCADNLDIGEVLDNIEGSSEEYKKEIKRLMEECKDSICQGKDRQMTITCDTIRIFLEEEKDANIYEEMKKECQKIREQLADDKDMADIVSSLITKEPYITFNEHEIDYMMNENLEDVLDEPSNNMIKNLPQEQSNIGEIMLNLNSDEILKHLKDIPEEKFKPFKQILGLMLNCICQIDINKKEGGLSTTIIVIIVMLVLLLLSIITYFFLKYFT